MAAKGDWGGYGMGGAPLSRDWRKFVAALGAAAGELGLSPLAGSDWYGSSANFDLEVRNHYPELAVEEDRIEPLVGKAGWTPEDETPPAGGPCPKCGGRIGRGSLAHCPKCQMSGFEAKLARQREMAGEPPPEPQPPKAQQRPARVGSVAERVSTRRERRAALRKGGGDGLSG